MERAILGQGSMSSLLVVEARVGGEDPAQVRFAQDHDMVQAFSSDRADQPLRVPILPGRLRRRWSIADAHGRKTSEYSMARSSSTPSFPRDAPRSPPPVPSPNISRTRSKRRRAPR